MHLQWETENCDSINSAVAQCVCVCGGCFAVRLNGEAHFRFMKCTACSKLILDDSDAVVQLVPVRACHDYRNYICPAQFVLSDLRSMHIWMHFKWGIETKPLFTSELNDDYT